MLLFSVVPMLLLYLIQRVQGLPAVQSAEVRRDPARAWLSTLRHRSPPIPTGRTTAGEVVMSYFTQMAGLAYHNFTSAAVGIALAIAFIRGIARRQKDTIGNFWVDMTRATLVGVACRSAWLARLLLVSQGVVQNLRPYDKATLVEPQQVPHVGARRQTSRRCQRQACNGHRHRADHRAGSGRIAGSHQAIRHQRWRLLQRQQRSSVRKSDAILQLHRDVRHLRDLRRTDLHPRSHDRFAASRLGCVVGHGRSLPCGVTGRLLG